MVQGWVGLCGEFETWQRCCRRAGSEQVETSIVSKHGGYKEEKRLYERIVAKLNYLADDRLDLKYATSCLASAVSSPGLGEMQAAKRV